MESIVVYRASILNNDDPPPPPPGRYCASACVKDDLKRQNNFRFLPNRPNRPSPGGLLVLWVISF